jgi:hypothetical protein
MAPLVRLTPGGLQSRRRRLLEERWRPSRGRGPPDHGVGPRPSPRPSRASPARAPSRARTPRPSRGRRCPPRRADAPRRPAPDAPERGGGAPVRPGRARTTGRRAAPPPGHAPLPTRAGPGSQLSTRQPADQGRRRSGSAPCPGRRRASPARCPSRALRGPGPTIGELVEANSYVRCGTRQRGPKARACADPPPHQGWVGDGAHLAAAEPQSSPRVPRNLSAWQPCPRPPPPSRFANHRITPADSEREQPPCVRRPVGAS